MVSDIASEGIVLRSDFIRVTEESVIPILSEINLILNPPLATTSTKARVSEVIVLNIDLIFTLEWDRVRESETNCIRFLSLELISKSENVSVNECTNPLNIFSESVSVNV